MVVTEADAAEAVKKVVRTTSARLRAARRLSWVVAGLMGSAAAGGLAVDGLYEDPSPLAQAFRGYDLVTLAVAVPVLVGVLVVRRSPRRDVLWLATLAFAIYNYSLYVFGASFNRVFLLHVGIVLAAAVALGLGIGAVHADVRSAPFPPAMPRRGAAAVLLLLAVPLASMWVYYSLRFAFTGQFPEESYLVLPDLNVHLGYALDLLLLVPAYATAAILLLRRSSWGVVLAPVLLISGAVHQLSYMTALLFQSAADIPGSSAFDPGEPLILAAYAVAAALTVRRLGEPGAQPEPAATSPSGAPTAVGLDLYWIPLGAGRHVVRMSGWTYEALSALLQRRRRCRLFHSALVATTPEGPFVIEMTEIRDAGGDRRGVVAEGPVGTRWLGRFRLFRYEVRRWRDGVIPDLPYAVRSPVRITDDPAITRDVLESVPLVPTAIWGRDEIGAGDMWNSNSVTAWLLATVHAEAAAGEPPDRGRAPGWKAGLVAARAVRLPSTGRPRAVSSASGS